MNTIRAFIAIEIPVEIQKGIARNIADLKKNAGKSAVRWVATENIHLTLKFLGDVSPINVELIQQMLASEANQHPGFEIHVGTFGCFPNPHRPRTLWVGLQAPPELASLQRGIEAAAAKIGYTPEERSFSPHLTVGRVRETATPVEIQTLRAALETVKIGELGKVQVNTVHLLKSDLQPGGAVYTRLFSAPLS
jgi:RNA 2',3'-cyclic 3'-phosphodiesterase